MGESLEPEVRKLLEIEPGRGESFEPLASGSAFRLERIVSCGAASPPGFWYDQDEPEWVVLLAGEATVDLRDGRRIALVAGDSIHIPADLQHRVTETSDEAIWLALHFQGQLARR
jgi:cupin 2 domain-containing protein